LSNAIMVMMLPKREKIKTNMLPGSVVFICLLAIFIGQALAAKKSGVPLTLPIDEAKPPGKYVGLSPVIYEGGMQPNCEDLNPEIGWEYIAQIDQWGVTYFEYQQHGSMGRMITVSSTGQRHMVFHETEGTYPVHPRYITYNCKNPASAWCGPFRVDGGPGINAGFGQILLLHDDREIILYHQASAGAWDASLAVGEEGYLCECHFTKLYDLPDVHQNPASPDSNGYWPRGCMVYDAEVDTDYIHIVTTEDAYGLGADKTIAYQRCVFQDTVLVCISPGGLGPYTRMPGVGNPATAEKIAVIDTIKTYSAVVISSPVSQKVAIVYTKHRGNNQVNNDVFYIESTNNGEDWLGGRGWPPIKHNVTDYDSLWPERAFTDVAACYDYNDHLHILWNSCYYDSATGDINNDANLMHWCDTDPLGFENASLVVFGYWDDGTVHPGAWNRNISKMSVSVQDPIYHPGGDPDSVYLFCTWTQFNLGDNSLEGMTNGDIYASVSTDGGKTWASGYNLTNTQTPDCDAGECLSEHWSSLAENMYNGNLHVEYVCDRDAGGVVQSEGGWTYNSMMYLHVTGLPIETHCKMTYFFTETPNFYDPPIKILPDSSRIITLELENTGHLAGDYEVTCSHPNVEITLNPAGTLESGEKKEIEGAIHCPGGEEFIAANIVIHECIGTGDDSFDSVTLHAVCSDTEYYECMLDNRTQIWKANEKCSLWVCCNTEQKLWDKRLEENYQQIIFSSGVIVATTEGNDTVVGRQDFRDTRTYTRDTLRVVLGTMEPYFPDEPCTIQKIHCTKTFICANNLKPPNHVKWWWISLNEQVLMFHGPDCPNWKREQIIKHVWIEWNDVPGWWPDQSPFVDYEDIYLGLFADVDAPFDTGCIGCNAAGYDYDRHLMWQHGWWNDTLPGGGHPEFEDYYVGLALTDSSGAITTPLGVQNVLNEEYIHPQEGWGWKEGELYALEATFGVNIHHPDSVDDRTVVLTAGMIPAGNDPDLLNAEFILIEAFIPTGLADLQAHIDLTRGEVIPELNTLGTVFSKKFPKCGDCNNDFSINIADVIYLVNYLFTGDQPPPWPLNRGDCNADGKVNIADIVCEVNYLFLGSEPPNCSGFGR
jgi:hypothetical protein